MKYDKPSRRLFLQGVGGAALALPALTSLLPREARAQAAAVPLRYFHLIHYNGAYNQDFYPSDDGLTQVVPGVYARSLRDIPGTISKGRELYRSEQRVANLAQPFDAYRDKVSVIRGLDLQINPNIGLGHTGYTTTTASHGQGEKYEWSIDMVLEKSRRFHTQPTAVPSLRLGYGTHRISKWEGRDQPVTSNPRVAFEKAFGACDAAAGESALAAQGRRRLLIVDRVFEDYKKHRDSSFISAQERGQLDDWMTMVHELESTLNVKMNATTRLDCEDIPEVKPTRGDVLALNARIAVAALAAGNTRVVTLVVDGYKDASLSTFDHSGVHAHTNNWRRQKDWLFNEYFVGLMSQMSGITEGNGKSLLDNTVMFMVPDMGDANHRCNDLAVLIAGGGASGKLRLGQYIDYRQREGDPAAPTIVKAERYGGDIGMPYNQLLVTLFNVFGLDKSDYQMDGRSGFGAYAYGERYQQAYRNKDAPLPYLFTG